MINLNNDLFLMNLQQASQKSSRVDEFKKVDPSPKHEGSNRTMEPTRDRGMERYEDKSFSNTLENVKEERKSKQIDNDKGMDSSKPVKSETAKAEKPETEKTDNRTPAEKRSEGINEANSESSAPVEQSETRPVTVEKSNSKAVALKMLVESIEKIAEKLDLNVNLSEGLDHIDLENPSDAVLEQLSEIVFTLKEINSLLTTAVEENVALDMNGVVIEPQEAAELEKALRVDLFRVELAIRSLGVSGEVSQTVAEKQDKPVLGNGIPQAVNPETLSMPQEQLKQILGDALEADEVKIETVLEKMKALANEKPVTQVKSETNAVVVEAGSNSEKQEKADVSNFDPQVMRRLLNVDKEATQVTDRYEEKATFEKNVEPETIHNTAHKPNPLKDLSLSSKFVELSSENLRTGSESDSSLSGITSKSSIAAQNLKMAATSAPQRNPEELVMNQVNQRFSYAVKNGLNEMRIALRPESLGKVEITIQMENDVVTARISVENQQVKQIIESNLQQLKNALEEQSLTAGSFDVNVNQGSKDQGEHSALANQDSNKSGNSGSSLSSVEEQDYEVAGKETGRRFGSNTVEYFG